ncbi:DUF4328 domain-containing protein [Cognatiyoonia koreensis]|nr:DUF4328 domain-containing protein [Cognatiyoonia koreensis]
MRDLNPIGRAAKISTVIYGVVNVIYAAVLLWYNSVYRTYLNDPNADQTALLRADDVLLGLGIFFLIAFIGCFSVNGRWIYLASKNAAIASPAPDRVSPGWAVGWYFVPIMNLFKPFTAMKEIWEGSVGLNRTPGSSIPGWLTVWWLLWIVLNIADSAASNIGTDPFSTPEDYINGNRLTAVIALLWLIPIYLFWRIIDEVTAAQTSASDVFA